MRKGCRAVGNFALRKTPRRATIDIHYRLEILEKAQIYCKWKRSKSAKPLLEESKAKIFFGAFLLNFESSWLHPRSHSLWNDSIFLIKCLNTLFLSSLTLWMQITVRHVLDCIQESIHTQKFRQQANVPSHLFDFYTILSDTGQEFAKGSRILIDENRRNICLLLPLVTEGTLKIRAVSAQRRRRRHEESFSPTLTCTGESNVLLLFIF